MFSIPKQFSAATRNEFSSQLAAFNSLASKTMEAFEKLVSLNLEAVKATREESMNAAKKILSAQTPQQVYAATSERLQANVQAIQIYARHLAEVSAGTQAEFIKIAQVQKAEAGKTVHVAPPAVAIELAIPAVAPTVAPQSVNDTPIAKAAPVAESVEEKAVEEEFVPNHESEATAPAEPAATVEVAAKKPVSSKPRAKAALAKSSVTSSFPNPAVKSLVKKPAAAKPATTKTPVASKKLTKPSAKKKV